MKKMNVAIRLYDKKADKLIDIIKNTPMFNLLYFADANEQMWGKKDYKYNLEYLSHYKMIDQYKNGIIDKVFISPFKGIQLAKDVYDELLDMGVKEEDIYVPNIPFINEVEMFTENNLEQSSLNNCKTLHRLQYHIADDCNMNCVACSHFSSLVRGEEIIDKMTVRRDLEAIKRIVNHIEIIDILGGEPLINNEWEEYVILTRELFPYSEIQIITNGIKLWGLDDSQWKTINDNRIIIRASIYPPMMNKAEELADLLKEKCDRYSLGRMITRFNDVFVEEPIMKKEVARKLCGAECNQIYKGRVTPCPRMMYIHFFNEYYNTSYPEEYSVENLNEIKTFDELIRLLAKPMEICKFCNFSLQFNRTHLWRQISQKDKKIIQPEWGALE